jgi:hypothetical protein
VVSEAGEKATPAAANIFRKRLQLRVKSPVAGYFRRLDASNRDGTTWTIR